MWIFLRKLWMVYSRGVPLWGGIALLSGHRMLRRQLSDDERERESYSRFYSNVEEDFRSKNKAEDMNLGYIS